MFLLFFSIFIICVLFSRISTGRFLTFLVDRLTAVLCIQPSSSQHHPPANLHLHTDVGPLWHRYQAGHGDSSRMFIFYLLNMVWPKFPKYQLHGKQQAKSLQNLHHFYMRSCTEPSLIRTFSLKNSYLEE